ncbi:MAG: helix-turn-helix domain-containing protein [Candidatus Bathyarchaeota archaeon]|nr:helix-turn-helix domain-containing protein [Candidatus Bathyarchaeota archaeon]MDH5495054.1 helix-turn-helix domain-containing protein [Candidatus Bathyarchaeota archaeon]
MEDVKSKLKGTTLQVYWHLLRSGKPTTIRRLQRELGLSSPSVASYHLEKLLDMELIRKNAKGDYELRKTVSLEVMSSFVRISQLMIPRYVFYTIFFFTLLIVFVVGYAHALSIQGIFALAFGGSGLVITAYETWRQWRLKPI